MRQNKIAVYTPWFTQTNYGQVLQAFALKTHLQKMGYESFIIRLDYQAAMREAKKNERFSNFFNFSAWCRLFKRVFTPKTELKAEEMETNIPNRHFDEFRNSNLYFSDDIFYTIKSLKRNPPKADVYITGSDQVWLVKFLNEASFLNFGNSDTKRIAYAASFGRTRPTDKKESRQIARLIRNFNRVGVRESSAIDIFSKLNYMQVELVPDPVLLLNKTEWLEIATSTNVLSVERTNVFSYIIARDNTATIYNIIDFLYPNENVIYTHADGCGERNNANPTIGEWIDLISKSDFIITNSFHCSVFCLLFNKEFITISRKNAMSTRLVSILELVGLLDRLVDKFDEKKLSNIKQRSIDWEDVNAKIELFKKTGVTFLERSLKF